ncbi:MAG TPA: MarR family transcriptional regulator [Kineosporiaceae bacterium]|nr:MarR family transcriptional regulator [Kineosporiaceae bacterium]
MTTGAQAQPGPGVPGQSPGAPEGGTLGEVLAARLAVMLPRLVRQLRRDVSSGVAPGSLAVLATLSRCGPMRLGDLAAREGVSPPTLSRIVAVLEEGGYLTRQVDPRDRRAAQAAVTERGAQLIQGVGTARDQALRARLARLTPEQEQALLAALPALEALAEDGPPA